MPATKSAKERPVIVTSAHKGVFFGYATKTDGPTIKLKNARLCIYWSQDMKGFMGLADSGPSKSCRVGPRADIELRDITAVVSVSQEAVIRWEASPWS